MAEKLAFQQIQQALTVLLMEADNQLLRKVLRHPGQGRLALENNPDKRYDDPASDWRDRTGIIETRTGRGERKNPGFDIRPVRGFRTHDVALAITDFFVREIGIRSNIEYRDKNLFGFPNKRGFIQISFPDRAQLEQSLNRHPHLAIQAVIETLRANRFAQEMQEAARQKERALIEREEHNRRTEQEAYAARRKGPAYINEKPLVMRALCVVHATKFPPRLQADGAADIDTTTTATDGAVFRNTVHVALNHKVAGHMYGNWDDVPYTVIGDFNATVERNGVPQSLNTVDTWWVRGWKEALLIPNALIVSPGQPGNGLRHITLQQAVYKAKNFTLAEAMELSGIASETTDAFNRIKRLLDETETVGCFERHPDFWKRFEALASQNSNMELKQALNSVFHFSSDQASNIEKTFSATNNSRTIDAAIDYLGYRVYPGGMWAWGGSWGVTDSTRLLAEQMGTICTNHSNDRQHDLETMINGLLAKPELKDNEGTKQDLHSLLDHPDLNPRSRNVAIRVLEKRGIPLDLKAASPETNLNRPEPNRRVGIESLAIRL